MNISVKLDECQRMATETGNRLVIHFVPGDGWQARCGMYAATHPDLTLALDTMLKQRERFNRNPPIEEMR
jgi:hypothetical protein